MLKQLFFDVFVGVVVVVAKAPLSIGDVNGSIAKDLIKKNIMTKLCCNLDPWYESISYISKIDNEFNKQYDNKNKVN